MKSNVADNNESNAKLALKNENNEWMVPYVIEPSAGVDRAILAILNEAYCIEEIDGKERIVLKLKPHLSPIKAAVIQLKKNDKKIVAKAKEIKAKLQKLGMGRVLFENSGNIGKNYRRHDEVGTPICITIDFETLDEGTVTIRDRDTMEQKRVPETDIELEFNKLF